MSQPKVSAIIWKEYGPTLYDEDAIIYDRILHLSPAGWGTCMAITPRRHLDKVVGVPLPSNWIVV